MTKPRFGSRKFSTHGRGNQIQSLPERKIATFRDFRRGYTPSEQRQNVEPGASPVTFNVEVREDNGIQRVPGTKVVANYSSGVKEIALFPTLNQLVFLVLVAPPLIGFRDYQGSVRWFNLGLADRDEFAYTTFGGVFFFSDGINVWYYDGIDHYPERLPQAPMARDYASFAGRIFAFGTEIDGQFEPLGVQWSDADSNLKHWDGLGSGFELLINDVSSGDEILAGIPMNLDMMAIMMRQSIWLGRFTGQLGRPADFSVRVVGVGAINKRVCTLSRFGVIFLSDNGVYLFDGNEATLLSESVNSDLLPLDYDNLKSYHAVYDPKRKRYILFTPTRMWTYEVEKDRWLYRTMTSFSGAMYPTQIDGIRWFEAVGAWNEQSDLIWLDFAPKNIGELTLYMLGDQTDSGGSLRRTLAEESYESGCFFGQQFKAYWETRLTDEQDASRLVSSVKQLVEYRGSGCLRLYLPEEDNRYEQVLQTELDIRDYPATAIFNAQKVGKGTGIGVEFCEVACPGAPGIPPEPEPDPDPDPDEPDPQVTEWSGMTIFSDVHASTPPEDSQQHAPLEMACFTWCDEEVCGGPGGFLVWFSNNPEHLEQNCDHPDNPIPGMLS